MNKLFFLLTFLILIYSSSCEKTANSSMSCPDLIQNVSLSDFPMDMYGINEISLVEDELFINVNYGGGCEEHTFKLIMEPIFCGTPPIYYYFYLSHDSNYDLCEALIIEHNLCFNISSILDGSFNDEVHFFFSHPDSIYNLN